MGYRACNSLYGAPAPLSAGGSSKMASAVRKRVRNVSRIILHCALNAGNAGGLMGHFYDRAWSALVKTHWTV